MPHPAPVRTAETRVSPHPRPGDRKERTIVNMKFVDRKGEQPKGVHFYAEKKVGKLDRYFRSGAEAVVTFTAQKKGLIRCEVAVTADGNMYRAEETTTDANASVDAAVTAIEGQIRKNKTRLARRLREGAFEPIPEEVVPQPEEDPMALVRAKKFPLKPMHVDEAILQMNLLGHTFFLFKNADDGNAFAVVYARNDGGYGLIQDED